MVSEQAAAHKITVNAAEQDKHIESVTVFQSNRAEVKRRVRLELEPGQTRVEIKHLPSCIDRDSIRVDGTGDVVIFDVVYHSPSARPRSSETESLITSARRPLEALQQERNLYREQAGFLGSYGKTLDSKTTNVEDAQHFLDIFVPRQLAVNKRIEELDIQIEAAQAEYDKVRRRTYDDVEDKRGAKITVTVLADSGGTVEFVLTYVATNARWTPHYDLRASIAQSVDEPSKVTLHYRASITQTTGENWPNVALKLSTASPVLGSVVPTLSSWRVGILRPEEKIYLQKEAEVEESDDDMGFGLFDDGPPASASPPAPIVTRTAQVTSAGVLSATFGIPGASDIPSDTHSHNVVIAVLDLKAELEWICVPKKQEVAFLTCKVANSSEFTLLPGEAHVFVDNNFVSKTQLEHVSPTDSFKASLGVDPALRITYPPAKKHNRTTAPSGFSFLSQDKRSISFQSQRIVIHNSRPTFVTGLRVLDHIPVSTDACIKVHIIAPSTLGSTTTLSPTGENPDRAQAKHRPWTDLQQGVKTRWAPSNVGEEGTVEWSCNIAPTEEVELEVAWEVSAPFGQNWNTLS